jgi:hypothetical protein
VELAAAVVEAKVEDVAAVESVVPADVVIVEAKEDVATAAEVMLEEDTSVLEAGAVTVSWRAWRPGQGTARPTVARLSGRRELNLIMAEVCDAVIVTYRQQKLNESVASVW